MEEKLNLEKQRKITKLIEEQFKEPKFLEWFNALSETEKDKFVPDSEREGVRYLRISKEMVQRDFAQNHFESVVWPQTFDVLKEEFI